VSEAVESPGAARSLVRTALEEHVSSRAIDSAQLAISELVTNALIHGRPPVEIDVWVVDHHVELAVVDHGGGTPQAQSRGFDSVGGYGLAIVNALATQVEYAVAPRRTEVRCVLPFER
jgi:anti-sigma regulatory factor (Ser/Thr protein kinase)